MQVQTLTASRPLAASSQAPATQDPKPSTVDSVSLGSSWKDTAIVKGLTNIARNVAIIGVAPALGAAGGLLGAPAALAGIAGGAAAGAYIGSKSEDLSPDACDRTVAGGGMGAAGALVGAVAAAGAGLPGAAVVVGFFAGVGAFRGLFETLSDYNLA